MKSHVISVNVLPGHADEVYLNVSALLNQEMGIKEIYQLAGANTYDVLIVTKKLGPTALTALLRELATIRHAKIVIQTVTAEDRSEWNDELNAV